MTFIVIIIGNIGIDWGNDDDLKIRERELEQLRAQIEKIDQSISENKNFQSQTNNHIQVTNTTIKTLEKEIATFNTNIDKILQEIEIKKKEIVEIENSIVDKNEILNNRLRMMYKNGTIGYFEVLLGAEDFIDFVSRIDMLQKILNQDQELIEFMEANRALIYFKKTELEEQKNIYEEQVSIKQAKQTELENELNDLEKYKEKLQTDEKTLVNLETEISNEANQLTQIIKKLNASENYVGGEMLWPVPEYYTITSLFGNRLHPFSKAYVMHTGIDISCPKDTVVVAAQSGTVVYANWFGSYGKVVILNHGGGYTTLYGYNDDLLVKIGDSVQKGDSISKSGNSGGTIKPCLHFEVRVNGDYQDPLIYVKAQ